MSTLARAFVRAGAPIVLTMATPSLLSETTPPNGIVPAPTMFAPVSGAGWGDAGYGYLSDTMVSYIGKEMFTVGFSG